MHTAVAHPMPVANGVPLAAIGACEEVPPCCVTVISACACRHVAGPANSPHCEECANVLSFSRVPAVREKRYGADKSGSEAGNRKTAMKFFSFMDYGYPECCKMNLSTHVEATLPTPPV